MKTIVFARATWIGFEPIDRFSHPFAREIGAYAPMLILLFCFFLTLTLYIVFIGFYSHIFPVIKSGNKASRNSAK